MCTDLSNSADDICASAKLLTQQAPDSANSPDNDLDVTARHDGLLQSYITTYNSFEGRAPSSFSFHLHMYAASRCLLYIV